MENHINGKLFDKNMKFCILMVHDLTNDISYDAKLNRSKNCYFGGKIVKILWKKSQEMGKYLYYPYLLIYWYTILHSGSSYIKLRYKLWFETKWVQKIVILG